MDIHSQNDTVSLGEQKFQLKILDILGENQETLSQYTKAYHHWDTLKNRHKELQARSREQQKESDYRGFLLEELNAASLEPAEQDLLENSLRLMEHAEEIKLHVQNSLQALDESEYSANEQVATANQLLAKISGYTPEYKALKDRLESCLIELRDIVQELNILDQDIAHEPAEIVKINTRLDTIYRLQKKHGVDSVPGLIKITEELLKESEQLVYLDDKLKELEKEINESEVMLMQIADKLSERRQHVFPILKQKMEHLLGKLGMPESNLTISSQPTIPGPNGVDDISLKFSANKGIAPQPISKVASGGEFSRLMFCIKYLIADKVSLPTMLFDEIDTGISGEVALQMVEMMHIMAKSHQVLTISHLPQFAAKADHHYYVYKESDVNITSSGIKKLHGDERVTEIAKMLGGNNPSEIAFANAKELLQPSN